jgi:hypothetical protein
MGKTHDEIMISQHSKKAKETRKKDCTQENQTGDLKVKIWRGTVFHYGT